MTRATATRLLVERLRNEVVVSNLGQATLDLQRLGDRPLNCYTFGAMGQCSSVALGLALARPDVRVICLDGDGSLLMNLGSLCTIATVAPRNYALLIWDNEVHMTTGGQPTATAHRSSLAALARGAGIDKVLEPRDEVELVRAYERVLSEDGPFVVPVKVEKGRGEGRINRDVVGLTLRFAKALQALPAPASR
jgi:thiamine pyrophosphate-dependent acetolactate synthase large subunit-like protein